jgi:hypothetical protein
MSPTDQIAVTFSNEPTAWTRLLVFLGPYDLRIYVGDDCYVDIGAGSLDAMERISALHAPANYSGCVGSVGRFCEFAISAEIMGRAEHDHDLPMNISFGLLRDLSRATTDIGMKPLVPFDIGNGVILSSGSKVLPGVKVGDGAVVGAGAIVTRKIAPMTIVAGVPAKALRQRPSFQPWWNFAYDYLLELSDRVQTVAMTDGQHRWRPERPRFVLRMTGAHQYSIEGFTSPNGVRPLAEAPASVVAYIVQAFSPGDSYVVPDCWA